MNSARELREGEDVTPGFKEQSQVHLIHAPKKTTYNNRVYRDTCHKTSE
jgi:hypothetical protein